MQTQPLAGDAPSVVSTNSFMSAGYVKFQRAYGHYMASGADSIDLGFAGALTPWAVAGSITHAAAGRTFLVARWRLQAVP